MAIPRQFQGHQPVPVQGHQMNDIKVEAAAGYQQAYSPPNNTQPPSNGRQFFHNFSQIFDFLAKISIYGENPKIFRNKICFYQIIFSFFFDDFSSKMF